MLERITDFMSHPDLIFGADLETSPEERFIRVLQYYLSGWHVKPKGVKKPCVSVLNWFWLSSFTRVPAIIPSLASSFVADMTTQMVHKDFTSRSKVRSWSSR